MSAAYADGSLVQPSRLVVEDETPEPEWEFGNFDWAGADEATSHFVNMDEVKFMLKMALIGATKDPLYKNVILWGQGGFGKSDFATTFVKAACCGIAPFVMSHHNESSTAEENGGIDLVKLTNGKLAYNVRDSWMNSHVAILEEAFDAPDTVLLALKDTITRREFTIGENFAIKTKLIIINTNHDPRRFEGDLSKAAFLERFPLKKRVDWQNLNISARLSAYEKIVDYHNADSHRCPMLQSVQTTLTSIAASELWSPRRVIQVVQTCQDYKLTVTGKDTDRVRSDDFMAVARMMNFDTADMIEKLARDERIEKINDFETSLNTILDGWRKQFQRIIDADHATTTDTEKVKIMGEIHNLVASLESATEKCWTVRDEFGQDSHAVVDRLRTNIEDITASGQMAWQSLLVIGNK